MQINEIVILALSPSVHGCGYAVFENALTPLECGVMRIHPLTSESQFKRISEALDFYDPMIVIMEASEDTRSRRSLRVRRLIRKAVKFAQNRQLKVYQYTREQMWEVFEQYHAYTKYEIAKVIVNAFPAFAKHLPPKRKIKDGEHYRTGMFDAMALGLTHYYITE